MPAAPHARLTDVPPRSQSDLQILRYHSPAAQATALPLGASHSDPGEAPPSPARSAASALRAGRGAAPGKPCVLQLPWSFQRALFPLGLLFRLSVYYADARGRLRCDTRLMLKDSGVPSFSLVRKTWVRASGALPGTTAFFPSDLPHRKS